MMNTERNLELLDEINISMQKGFRRLSAELFVLLKLTHTKLNKMQV